MRTRHISILTMRILAVASLAALPVSSYSGVSHPSTFNLEPSTFNLQLSTCNLQVATCNLRQSHQGHEGMTQRGNAGMGFDQEKTTHHFRLLPQGGSIEVETRDASDTIDRDQIRAHLRSIAEMFKSGDFRVPVFVHDQAPPGVEAMKQLKDAISYKYQETDLGGRVVISTNDPRAIEAIHSFLRFQIREHATGDSLEVVK